MTDRVKSERRKSKMKAREFGSEFQLFPLLNAATSTPSTWERKFTLTGSGRDALRLLLAHGKRRRGWQRIWIPSYFCQDVVASMARTKLRLQVYSDSPDQDFPSLKDYRPKKGDVVFIVNYFGLRNGLMNSFDCSRTDLIEDHTHDPWSSWARKSKATYCIASLRKTLPVPDGGIIWSPVGENIPPPPPLSVSHQRASAAKFEAMTLKYYYLNGHNVEKDVFRSLFKFGEESIASKAVSGISAFTNSVLSIYPADNWRSIKKRNFGIICDRIGSPRLFSIIKPRDETCFPFSVILLFESEKHRNAVRNLLINMDIYPAILWPLEKPVVSGIPDKNISFSRRMLSIHCDMRYDKEDAEFLAKAILKCSEISK